MLSNTLCINVGVKLEPVNNLFDTIGADVKKQINIEFFNYTHGL